MENRPPVTDWATDFDHFDPQWTRDPFPIWADLRQRCPVATSKRFEDGGYLPTRYEDVREIAYDAEHFSSRRVIVREQKLPLGMATAPPITSDPPEHTAARKLLLPAFAPKEIARLEEKTRAVCRSLLDAMGDRAEVDGAVDYAQHIPVRVIAHMLGVPEEDGDLFRSWIQRVLIDGVRNPQIVMPTVAEMTAYFAKRVAERRVNPGDDLVSFLLAARVDGKPLSDEHVLGTLRLTLIAGIDTTWSGIGASIWHLATHAQDRARLVADPGLMQTAIEEFLRAYSPVTMAREVVKEREVGGCPFKPGGQILLSFPAANRDPAMFEAPDEFRIDREVNPHAAFGLGRHRCIGSNLARMEMTIAVAEWLKRFPDFSETPGKTTTWSEGTVRGPRKMPITILRRA